MEEEIIERNKRIAKVIARAWSDQDFKGKFISEPKTVLKEYELHVPAGVEVKVLEQTDDLIYIVLPLKPGEDWLIKPMMSEETDEISCVRCV